jgi:hypothetical protein
METVWSLAYHAPSGAHVRVEHWATPWLAGRSWRVPCSL